MAGLSSVVQETECDHSCSYLCNLGLEKPLRGSCLVIAPCAVIARWLNLAYRTIPVECYAPARFSPERKAGLSDAAHGRLFMPRAVPAKALFERRRFSVLLSISWRSESCDFVATVARSSADHDQFFPRTYLNQT
jgi:hypothetical protein